MMRGFYYDEKARKRPKTMSLKDLQLKAERGIITEEESKILDSMMVRVGCIDRKDGA